MARTLFADGHKVVGIDGFNDHYSAEFKKENYLSELRMCS